MTLLYALILLGVLIFVHELGHFIVAKLMRVKVLKFSLGFGPKVIGKKIGETEYLISSFPLGGYVKMLGEDGIEEIPEEEKPRAYHYQPVWRRFLIVFSGPLFNLLFASLLFSLIFLVGYPVLLPQVGEVMQDSPAERVGIVRGDTITEIEGRPVSRWDEMTEIIHKNPGKELSVKIKRDNQTIQFNLTPEKKEVPNIFGEKKEVGLIGIKPLGSTRIEREALHKAVINSIEKTWDISVFTVVSIIKLIQRIIPAETIGGPILIFQMAGQEAAHGPLSFFTFMAIISINLGVLNLLPIPILDGGHILFLTIEAVRRKPLGEKVIMVAQRVGLAIIITLMVFAFYNDIMRLLTGKSIP